MTNVNDERTGGKGLLGALGDSLRDNPAVQRFGDQAREYLQSKGQSMVGSLTERLEDSASNGGFLARAGAAGAKDLAEGESPGQAAAHGVLSGVTEKVKSAFGGGGGKGGGGQKAMYIIEDIDVGVPVSVAYDQWTQFEEFASFMKGVESVDQRDEIESTWKFKVFKSRRTNKSTVSEQIPDRRIAWNQEGAKGTCKGVVTFHPLGDDLTKVLLVLEYYPAGFVEKTGNIWRSVGRRARLDLKRYRDYVTMQGEASGSWRGEIRDSEVVKQPDEDEDEDEAREQQPPDEDSDGHGREEQDEEEEEDDEGR